MIVFKRKPFLPSTVAIFAEGSSKSSSNLHFARSMIVRSLVLAVFGFSALFFTQGCGGENS